MNRSVIVFGPQGCGKGLAAQQIARAFGLGDVIDEWHPGAEVPELGTLILANEDPQGDAGAATVMRFEEALKAAGIERFPDGRVAPLKVQT